MIQSSIPFTSTVSSGFLDSNTNYKRYNVYSDTSFNSIFSYSSLPNDDDLNDNYSKDKDRETLGQSILRKCIISAAFILILFTLPISICFTFKRIKPLERCIVYRLGRRLPVKGPGLIIVIPLVDVIDRIDLNPQRICIVDKEQMITSDGSMIEIIDFIVEITVANAIRTSTQLRDSRSNVEQFIKLSFINTIGGMHVEDLERKMEFIVKQYSEMCNQYLNRWGWSMVIIEFPKIKVLSRAEPVNHVVKALKGYFGIKDGQPNRSATDLISSLSSLTPTAESNNNLTKVPSTQDHTKSKDELLVKLEKMAQDYRYLSMLGFNSIIISLQIEENSTTIYFKFNPSTGDVIRLNVLQSDEKPQIIVKSASWINFNEAVDHKDSSKLQIINNLI